MKKNNSLHLPNLKTICYLLEMNVKKMIRPNCHPTYNERQQKIIKMIDWVLEKYQAGANIKMTDQENGQQEVIIIEDIIQELNKKRKIAINKKQKCTKR